MDLRVDYITMVHRQISALGTIHDAASSTLGSTLPNALDCTFLNMLPSTLPCTLSSTLPMHSMVHSQPAWLYTPKHALKHARQYATDCTQLHTPSLHDCMFPSAHSSTLPLALDCTLPAYLAVLFQVRSQEVPLCADYLLRLDRETR
jgi:hypothetical protein